MSVKGHTIRLELAKLRSGCSNCSLSQLCLPYGLDGNDLEQLDHIVGRARVIKRGTHLYCIGEDFEAIFAVRSGALKTYTATEDGEEQITGFHLPGEVVGLDAVGSGVHPCGAVALETSSICRIPFVRLEELAAKIPGLQHQLLRLMSQEIFRDEGMLLALARRSAEERLAIALFSFSKRYARQRLSATRFRLPMSHSDLGNYLGLVPETVSRLFRRLADKGWISVRSKEVIIHDLAMLEGVATQGRGPSGTGVCTPQ